MSEITSTVWGFAPQSDELLKASGDLHRERIPFEGWLNQVGQDRQAYVGSLKDASITYSCYESGDGDYLRLTARDVEGFGLHQLAESPVTRWFDTNTFYRQPTIEGELHHLGRRSGRWPHWPFFDQFDQANVGKSHYQATLLSPYSFARLCARSPRVSQGQADRFVLGVYDELLDIAANHEIERVLLHEPYAAYHAVGARESRRLAAGIGDLAVNHPAVEVGVYLSFGNATDLIGELAKVENLAALGCDLIRTPVAGLPRAIPGRFLAGLVDGANTLIDDDTELVTGLETLATTLDVPEISVTHTVDLEHVPFQTALQKVRQLGRIADLAGEVHNG